MTLTTITKTFRLLDRPTSHVTLTHKLEQRQKALSPQSSRKVTENPNLHRNFQSIRSLRVELIRWLIMRWQLIYFSKIRCCLSRTNGFIITCIIIITTFHGCVTRWLQIRRWKEALTVLGMHHCHRRQVSVSLNVQLHCSRTITQMTRRTTLMFSRHHHHPSHLQNDLQVRSWLLRIWWWRNVSVLQVSNQSQMRPLMKLIGKRKASTGVEWVWAYGDLIKQFLRLIMFFRRCFKFSTIKSLIVSIIMIKG